MNDLEIAKDLLYQKQLTLIIIKKGRTLFETQSHRISGFLNAIQQFGKTLKGAAIADKVVGKAVALLCVYAGIKAVYAETLSRKAEDLFEQHRIEHEWKNLIDNILNDTKTDVCPFEKEAATITVPKEAYDRFRILQQNLKACR